MLLSTLRSCAGCADETDATLCCARCHTIYCSRPCQKARGLGPGRAQEGLRGARARARRDMDLEVQSRALARVSHMSGGGAGRRALSVLPRRRRHRRSAPAGVPCRGSSGWTHIGCLVKSAEAARAPPPPAPYFAPWLSCSTCKQQFTGQVLMRLAIALWVKHAYAVETDGMRLTAAELYAAAIVDAGEHAEATRLQRGILDARTRTLRPEHSMTLNSASN